MKRKLSTPKSTYRHNAQIGEYHMILTSAKKIQFWPSTHVMGEESLAKIASNSWQAEVIARSTCYQTLWTDKNLARYHRTTKLVLSGRSRLSIALKLLSNVRKYVKPKPISCQNKKLTQQHNWKKSSSSPRTASAFGLCPSFCLSVRAKRGIWSKRVFMRTNGNFSFSGGWRNTTIIH